MASMRDIKRRKGSIQSTQQITKAMKLVSTVKLQKAKRKAEESKPYFNAMYRTVCSILAVSYTHLPAETVGGGTAEIPFGRSIQLEGYFRSHLYGR